MTAAAAIDWRQLGNGPDPCIVCGSGRQALLYPPTYRGSIEAASAYFLAHRTATAHGPIARCGECGFVFTSPRFDPRDYDRIYRAVRPPENMDSAFQAAKVARFERLGAIVRKFQPSHGPFLDFGCGDGSFLEVFEDPAGLGFEVGSAGRRTVGRCEIVTGDWASVAGKSPFPERGFDFVTAFDVLEHLPRLKEDVELIRQVLKPGGLFFASVPNIESAVARIMGRRWNMILLEHLWYFSPDTYRRMMSECGFETLHIQGVPFDAPVAHLATRLAQTFGMKGTLNPGPLSKLILPVPAGLMLGVFRKVG